MEVNKNQAEVNWQYPMLQKYQAEANKCPRMYPAEVTWQYPMVQKYQAKANKPLVPDGPQVQGRGQQMPERLTIGTRKAFEKNYPFAYEKKHMGSETIYVCTKGSEWARTNEVLVLRCVTGTWTAFDSAVSADGLTLQCRQPVFRCLATDITQPGWHNWQTNHAASPNDAGLAVDWHGALWAETRVP